MKKQFYFLTLPFLLSFSVAHAEDNLLFSDEQAPTEQEQTLEDGEFFDKVLISEDLQLKEDARMAREKARALLEQKPKVIKIDGLPANFRTPGGRHKFNSSVSTASTTTKYGESPFGMSWGATYEQTKSLGVTMESVKRQGSSNNFIVTELPKPLPDFTQVIISFGENNSLYKISAYSNPITDDASASEGLQLYHKYYKLLEVKYGNAKETYTPKITVIETPYQDNYGIEKVKVEKKSEPIGGKNFKNELQNQEAILYATFENENVGAALALTVDENGKSYIIIDYINLRIFKEREQNILDAL